VLRDAQVDECDRLSDLAFASKAHWGYDAAFMAASRADLTVAPDLFERATVRVATDGSRILGFHAVEPVGAEAELSWLFVAVEAMGGGVGRLLFTDAVAVARAAGAPRMRIEADPNASAFYVRLGAVQVGEVPSSVIEGRVLPLLEVDVTSMT
jgi:GNAT superfamily N-acetyltransferase